MLSSKITIMDSPNIYFANAMSFSQICFPLFSIADLWRMWSRGSYVVTWRNESVVVSPLSHSGGWNDVTLQMISDFVIGVRMGKGLRIPRNPPWSTLAGKGLFFSFDKMGSLKKLPKAIKKANMDQKRILNYFCSCVILNSLLFDMLSVNNSLSDIL